MIQNKKKGQSETINNVNKDESHKSVLKQKFKKLFDGIGLINNHIVRTKFKTPLNATQQKGRRIPIALQDKVHEEIRRLLKNGHIKKVKACNEDQFISPIVITVTKDGSLKLALDSKKLNESVIKNKCQMPNIDELIDQMSQIVTAKKLGRVWYSSIDLIYAYGQLLPATETAKQCNSNIIGEKATGTCQFQTGFSGLADMPTEFQLAMDRTLRDLEGVFAFIDDVLIVTKGTEEDHMRKVHKVLERMDKVGMAIKLEKCKFAQ